MGVEQTTFGEYAKVQGGYAYKSKDFIETSLNKVLKIKNVRFGTVNYDDSGYISDELALATNAWQAKEGDILISMTGSGPNAPQSLVGRVARVWKREPAAWINQRVGRIQLKNKGSIHSDFLFYLLSLPQSQEFLVSNSSGSANQANISGKIIELLPCPKVSFNQSKSIADIARSLDEKIILNKQTNQTLEQMAQTLFKSWFVDFDPVIDNALAAGINVNDFPEALQNRAELRKQAQQLADYKPLPDDILIQFSSEFEQSDEPSIGISGWIPKGWNIVQLSEVTTELRRGISPKYLEEGGIQVINQKCIRNHEVNFALCRRNDPELRKVVGRKLLLGDVLVNSTGVGTLGRMAQVNNLPEPTVADSHVTVVRPDISKCPAYTFGQLMLANERRVEALGEGSTGQTELSRKILSEQKVILPPMTIALHIESTFKSYAEKQISNCVQIKTLQKLRDTLLPKLISGELQIPDTKVSDEKIA